MKYLSKDKRGVFGLTAVQSFFAIILGLALLAYVIVIIMGTLSTANIVPTNTLSTTVVNESVANPAGATSHLAGVNELDGHCNAITAIYNVTGPSVNMVANFTQSGTSNCVLSNITSQEPYGSLKISYTYTYSISSIGNGRSITNNVSTGVSSFFGAINPIYAILAILVIILVLIVLVRVVQAPNGREGSNPQL